jgi:hypothetical protein
MPKVDIPALAELFRASVLRMLKDDKEAPYLAAQLRVLVK